MTEKRPRQHAAAIQALPTREERLKALGQVSEHLKSWVKDLLNDSIKYGKARQEAMQAAKDQRLANRRTK